MKYQIRQKALSAADRFSIKDDEGRDVYTVEGKAVRVVDQLRFCDKSGRELLTIRQKVLSGSPTYRILRGDDLVATIKKAAVSLKPKFRISVENGPAMEITGNLAGLEFEVKEGKRTVATVSKKLFAVADTYGIEISDDADQALVLAAVVAVDQMQSTLRRAM